MHKGNLYTLVQHKEIEIEALLFLNLQEANALAHKYVHICMIEE